MIGFLAVALPAVLLAVLGWAVDRFLPVDRDDHIAVGTSHPKPKRPPLVHVPGE